MTQSIEIQRKKQFLLKQTAEQRAQLDTLAAEVSPSLTAYVQALLDEAWAKYQARKYYATAEAQVTKAPPAGDPDELLAPTPCACDGNCAGCDSGKGAA